MPRLPSRRYSASHSGETSQWLLGEGAKASSGLSMVAPIFTRRPQARCSGERDLDLRAALEPRRNRQLPFAQKLRIEQLRLVARTVVAKNGDDGMPRTKLLCHTNGACNVDAGRPTEAKSFVLEQVKNDRYCFVVGNLIGGVDRRAFEIFGDAALADAFGDRGTLGLERASRVVAVKRGAHRIGERGARRAIESLQRHRDAGERAAGADGADEAVDLAVGLPPDFRPRRFDVTLTVGDVVELVRPDRAVLFGLRQLFSEPAGKLHVVVGVGIWNGRHLDQFGAAQPQHIFLLVALGFRDDDHGAIAHRIADEGKPDAGVACRALDDDSAGLELTLLHRVLDNEQCGAVLHRLTGIHELGLAENGAAGRGRDALELDQRRVADRLDDSFTELHRRISLKRRRPTEASTSVPETR